MASDSIDEQPIIEVAHSYILVIGYLFDKSGGKRLLIHTFISPLKTSALDVSSPLAAVMNSIPGMPSHCSITPPEKTCLHHHEKFTVTPFEVHILKTVDRSSPVMA